MFQAIILPIFRSTRLCYSLWYKAPTMLLATSQQHRYIFLRLAKQSQFILLQNAVYFITLPFLVHKHFTKQFATI